MTTSQAMTTSGTKRTEAVQFVNIFVGLDECARSRVLYALRATLGECGESLAIALVSDALTNKNVDEVTVTEKKDEKENG